MGAEQHIATVKAMYDALSRGEIDAILDRVTDDVDWSTDAAIESAPWYGPRHGKDEVRGFFDSIVKTGPVTRFAPLSFTSNEDGDVLTVTVTGQSAKMNLHHYWRFRDGKACFVRSSEDTALVASTLTL